MMARKPKHPGGRPVSTGRGAQARTRVTVSLSAEEAATYERAAKRRDMSVAAYLRERSWESAQIDAAMAIGEDVVQRMRGRKQKALGAAEGS